MTVLKTISTSAVAIALLAGIAGAEAIKVAVVQPQSGACAQWGVPITRGVEIWAEEFNEAGGIKDASGTSHMIEVTGYDNECYTAGGEINAFREAVLADGNQFVLQTFTPASRQAIAQMTTDNKVLATSYGAGFLSPDHPFLMGSVTGSPASYMYLVAHIIEANPDIRKIAVVTTDNSFGEAARAFYRAGIAPYVDQVEIVFDNPYDPDSANDMIGLATPIAASDPDLIVELGFTPGQQALFIEAMQQLGYEGKFGGEGWTMKFIQERVNAAYIDNRLYSAYVVDASEPTFSPRVTGFYDTYVETHGAEEWSVLASVAYAAMTTIEAGIQMTDEPTGEAVQAALFASDTVDQPLFGTSSWGGAEIYGSNTHLQTPLPIYISNSEGGVDVDSVVDVASWWSANKDAALIELTAGGQVSAE